MSEKHALQVALENARDHQGVEISIRDYSGRGMFGKVCLAVTFDRYVSQAEIIAEAIACAAEDGIESLNTVRQAIKGASTDSMGLGTVLYWPNVPYTEGDE